MRAHHDTILTIDLGGELARVIVHKIRDLNVYCELITPHRAIYRAVSYTHLDVYKRQVIGHDSSIGRAKRTRVDRRNAAS